MKFDVVFNAKKGPKKFKKISLNGISCIKGTPKNSKMTEGEESISVIYSDDKQVTPYPSGEIGKVFHPVKIGDCIIVNKKDKGTLYSDVYRVKTITHTEVICGPVE